MKYKTEKYKNTNNVYVAECFFDMQNIDKSSSRLAFNIAFQTSIEHLEIIVLSAYLICKSDVIEKPFRVAFSSIQDRRNRRDGEA